MKVALCFIISYDHVLNKETIWREWIEPNKDILNVYFYYKTLDKITSPWIREHAIPTTYIYETSYYYVIPAYLSVLKYASIHDSENKWFCLLTDSCCPIISPIRFRTLFQMHCNQSIFAWKSAWWNPFFHKRANLALLPKECWLGNEPWFVLTRKHVMQILYFIQTQERIANTICSGGLANESLFAIILIAFCKEHKQNKNNENNSIINTLSHLTDWSRPSSKTSPHVFKEANEQDMAFIESELAKECNRQVMFLRKVDSQFPDHVLRTIIYERTKKEDDLIEISTFELGWIWIGWVSWVLFVASVFLISMSSSDFRNLSM